MSCRQERAKRVNILHNIITKYSGGIMKIGKLNYKETWNFSCEII